MIGEVVQCPAHPDSYFKLDSYCPWCVNRFAVIRICCDRADGVEYFADHCGAVTWRMTYERERDHVRIGVLVEIDDQMRKPPRVGLEDHQRWVWLKTHWEVVGTGARI